MFEEWNVVMYTDIKNMQQAYEFHAIIFVSMKEMCKSTPMIDSRICWNVCACSGTTFSKNTYVSHCAITSLH